MLEVKNINQYYGSSHTLKNVSFTVPTGAVTTLLGRNGVGKTTLLNCLMGVLETTSGTIHVNGSDVTGQPSYVRARQGVGYVPQGREIFARLTVEENLLMGLATKSRGELSDLPHEIFDMFPVLNEMLHRRGGDLSGGQQQQLAIGRALAMSPNILILDEPTEGIQPSIIKDIGNAIRLLAARGDMAILLVEQYYDFAKDLADHYIILQRGEVIKSGLGEDMDVDNVRHYLSV
ncbi:MAG: urea ABC transporter ATP-binding subunit UrtE [Burkholderiales bacterium]|jgi:urea transport system ATP-binding protein|nr:urea ABC transporter ATP-binding subunit UrtE [Pseudomonadota bacterium]MDA1012308.1 urea ABC transporter ATP-binding subunit UrtE [Pseudomonadota bacterium]